MSQCSVCEHPKRRQIEQELELGRSLRAVGLEYGVDKNAVHNHKRDGHIGQESRRDAQVKIAREQIVDDGLTAAFGDQLDLSNKDSRSRDVNRILQAPPDAVTWIAFLECVLPKIAKFGYAWNRAIEAADLLHARGMTDLATLTVSFISAERLAHALDCYCGIVPPEVVDKRSEYIPHRWLEGVSHDNRVVTHGPQSPDTPAPVHPAASSPSSKPASSVGTRTDNGRQQGAHP